MYYLARQPSELSGDDRLGVIPVVAVIVTTAALVGAVKYLSGFLVGVFCGGPETAQTIVCYTGNKGKNPKPEQFDWNGFIGAVSSAYGNFDSSRVSYWLKKDVSGGGELQAEIWLPNMVALVNEASIKANKWFGFQPLIDVYNARTKVMFKKGSGKRSCKHWRNFGEFSGKLRTQLPELFNQPPPTNGGTPPPTNGGTPPPITSGILDSLKGLLQNKAVVIGGTFLGLLLLSKMFGGGGQPQFIVMPKGRK